MTATTTTTRPDRAEINRRNAQWSTGPKTQAGKERSRFNALKHGCRATLPILPGEDPEAYQERLDAWIDRFQPRDDVETYMVERAVQASWQLDRADRAEVATMVEAAEDQAVQRSRDVLALGETLFRAPARGLGGETDGVRVRDGDDRPLSWPFDPEHPRYPSYIVDELEGTAQGCTWLLQRWTALGEALEGGRIWRAVDRLRAIRLLGKQPLEAVADEAVLSIYLACQAMDPHGPDVLAEPLIDLLHPKAAAAYQRETERFAAARAERSPRDAAEGRAALRAIVSTAVARLEALREDRTAAEAEAPGLSEVSARMPHRTKETLEWLWKHQARCSRSLCRTFDELRKVRRDSGDDLPDSPGPMSDIRGPSSGSESVEGSDLLATVAGPAAVEPAGDLDARDVTNEAASWCLKGGNAPDAGLMTNCDEHISLSTGPPEGGTPTVIAPVFAGVPPSGGPGAIGRPPDGGTPTSVSEGMTTLQDVHLSGLMTPPECPTLGLPQSFNRPIADSSHEAIAFAESFSATAVHGQQTMDRTNEAIATPEPPRVTTDPTNVASALADPLPATSDNVQGTTDLGPRGERGRAGQSVIVLALLALLFSTVVAAAIGTSVAARATAPRAFPDHGPRPGGQGDHNVTNEPNPAGLASQDWGQTHQDKPLAIGAVSYFFWNFLSLMVVGISDESWPESAREALAHSTGDYAFWLDADDVAEPAEREKLGALLDGLDPGESAEAEPCWRRNPDAQPARAVSSLDPDAPSLHSAAPSGALSSRSPLISDASIVARASIFLG